METTIKKHYNDALYFASSYINEKEAFYITPLEYKVMLKLINYSKKQEYITWSSANIAMHMMEKEGAVQKAIQRIAIKKLIFSQTIIDNNKAGEIVKRRKIRINWELLEYLLAKFKAYSIVLTDVEESTEIENEVEPTPAVEKISQPEVSKCVILNDMILNEVNGDEYYKLTKIINTPKKINPELVEKLTNILNENCSSYMARVPIQTRIEAGELTTISEVVGEIPRKHLKQIN